MDQEDDINSISAFTEDEFNTTLAELEVLFRPLFSFHGGRLVVDRLWSSSTVNAFARRNGDDWIVEMHGGLARRKEITVDGLSFVLCHELGHHLGGYPYKGDNTWAAAEGQADYYAAQSCARWLWWGDAHNADFRSTAPSTVVNHCDAEWSSTDEQNLCIRIAMAGHSLATMLAEGAAISFETPSSKVVTSTVISHPAAQCRLDTYLAGALCTIQPDLDRIAGFDEPDGRNSVQAELDSAFYTCSVTSELVGASNYNGWDRPECWFKSQISGPAATP